MTASLFSVAGKRVLITGGSRGIGYMIARGFLEAGATVIITARKAEPCLAAGEALSQVGPCRAVPADVSTTEGVATLVDAAGDELDVLVNNAGATWGAPVDSYPTEAFAKVLGTNVTAPFALTAALLPALRKTATAADPARVINVGSVDGIRVPGTDNFAYSASKAGIHMLTRQLALKLAPEAITVNAIAPGPFESKMIAFLLDDPEARAAVEGHVPLGRIGEPEDVAGAAIFLASRAGAYLTGAIIPVDGGLGAR